MQMQQQCQHKISGVACKQSNSLCHHGSCQCNPTGETQVSPIFGDQLMHAQQCHSESAFSICRRTLSPQESVHRPRSSRLEESRRCRSAQSANRLKTRHMPSATHRGAVCRKQKRCLVLMQSRSGQRGQLHIHTTGHHGPNASHGRHHRPSGRSSVSSVSLMIAWSNATNQAAVSSSWRRGSQWFLGLSGPRSCSSM